ncbi:MAG: hypothetical protein ACFB0G_00205 [Leptolyngbyaceae cyanobacterium]
MTRSHRPIVLNVMQQYNLKNLDFDAWSSAVRQQMLESLLKRRMIAQQDSPAPSDRDTPDRDAK